MGIYINGMEMPSHCTECDFWHDGIFEHCMLNDEIQNEDVPFNDGEYPRDCPLISVPPHGRLIDADALVKKQPIPELGAPRWLIEQAPTIIPAEEGE